MSLIKFEESNKCNKELRGVLYIYKKKYHIAINEVLSSEFGIRPASKTRISKAQYSKLYQRKMIDVLFKYGNNLN